MKNTSVGLMSLALLMALANSPSNGNREKWTPRATSSPRTGTRNAISKPVKLESLLRLRVMAFPLKNGLYVNVSTTNLSMTSIKIPFPSSARIEVQALQNGCRLWDSLTGQRFIQNTTALILEGEQIDTFGEFWPFKPGAFSGRITLQARLLTKMPVEAKPMTINLPTPAPNPLKSPTVLATPATPCSTPSPARS